MRKDYSLELLEGARPSQHIDLRLLASKTRREQMSINSFQPPGKDYSSRRAGTLPKQERYIQCHVVHLTEAPQHSRMWVLEWEPGAQSSVPRRAPLPMMAK